MTQQSIDVTRLSYQDLFHLPLEDLERVIEECEMRLDDPVHQHSPTVGRLHREASVVLRQRLQEDANARREAADMAKIKADNAPPLVIFGVPLTRTERRDVAMFACSEGGERLRSVLVGQRELPLKEQNDLDGFIERVT